MLVFAILAFAVIVGASWLAGSYLNKRGAQGKGRRMSRQDAITAAKVSGAFPVRKENQP